MNIHLQLPNLPTFHFEMEPAEFSLLADSAKAGAPIELFGAKVRLTNVYLRVNPRSGIRMGTPTTFLEADVKAFFEEPAEAAKFKFG